MIEFPETATTEWALVAGAAKATEELKARIKRDSLVEYEKEKMLVRHEATLAFNQVIEADLTPVLEMSTLANYQATPSAAPVDLIEGVMSRDGLCIVIGPAASGKSTLALQMAHSLITGDDWLGQKVLPISGGVGIMSYDMDASMMMDWMKNFPGVDPSKISVVNAFKRGNPLGVAHYRQMIAKNWKAMGTEFVIIDSFSASFFLQDQNDAAATMQHYRDLTKFALTEVGARALVVIAHSTESSPGRVRGSTVHQDVADSIVSVTVDKATQSRKVQMEKYRAALGQVQMSPVVITAPDSVTHLVDLDPGAMMLGGMHLPPSAGAAAFEDLPEPLEEPDTNSDSGDEEDDL